MVFVETDSFANYWKVQLYDGGEEVMGAYLPF